MNPSLLAFCAVAVTVSLAAETAGTQLVTRVLRRVHDYEPTREERRLDLIGWAADIREAQRLAREHARPIFLFTHDGNIATGRC
jgi:hypothetical protein